MMTSRHRGEVLHTWSMGDWTVEAVCYTDRLYLLYQVETTWEPKGGRRVVHQGVKKGDELKAAFDKACDDVCVEIAKLAFAGPKTVTRGEI